MQVCPPLGCSNSIQHNEKGTKMTQILHTKSSDHMVKAILALDLEPIKRKLMDQREGHGWTQAQADYYEQEYKRFLILLARFPEEMIAPDVNVDKFWHGHILDTMKYAEDCDNVFGFFLHHFPYFGMRGKEDAASLANAAMNMRRLYEQEFGKAERQESSSAYCAMPTVSYCARVLKNAAAETGEDTEYCA